MDEPLKLTPEDIEEAQQLAQAAPVTPEVLTIQSADLPPELSEEEANYVAPPIKITYDDLKAVPPLEQVGDATTSARLQAMERLMFELVNHARRTHLPRWLGNANLRWHPDLAAVARGHAADMLKRQYVSHNSPEGIKAAQRIEQYGLSFLACGENIGVVYGEASHSDEGIHKIHTTFMNQPRSFTNHRGNLLNPIWTHAGIGIAYDPAGTLIVTQSFILAPGSGPRQR